MRVGCGHEAFVVMDGDAGRKLNKNRKPLTAIARTQKKRLADLGVLLEVLERYGIENYFPQKALEAVTGKNLSAYFPIPDHVAVNEYLSCLSRNWKERSSVKIAERAYEKRAEALHGRREGCHPETAFVG
jgi:hypothetical protein